MHNSVEKSFAEIILEIVKAIQARNLVIFCGAGISLNSGLPSAESFKNMILKELKVEKEELYFISGRTIPFESFIGILQENSSIDPLLALFEKGEPSSNHLLIASLMIADKVNTVVTTNFDMLIERALSLLQWQVGIHYDVFYRTNFVNEPKKIDENGRYSAIDWNSTRPKLIKIHGSVEDGSVEHKQTMAITMREVAGNLHSASRKKVIDQIFNEGNHEYILVLGYSASDFFDINPYLQAIEDSDKKILFIQHDGNVQRVEDIHLWNKNNPFLNFKNSYRVFCKTDVLMQEIKKKCSVDYYDPPKKTDDSLWMPTTHEWCAKLLADSEVSAHIIIGRLLLDVMASHTASRRFKIAIDTSKDKHDKKREAFALALHGDATSSIPEMHRALALASEIGDKNRQADCLATLTKLYHLQGDDDEAIHCGRKGMIVAQSVGDKQHEVRILGNLGGIYGAKGKFKKAIFELKKARLVSRKIGDKAEEVAALFNIGITYELRGMDVLARLYYRRSYQIAKDFLGEDHPVTRMIGVKFH